MRFYNLYLLGVQSISSHAHKTGSWYLQGVPFKNSNEHPRLFIWETPPGTEFRFKSVGHVLFIYGAREREPSNGVKTH